MSMTRSALSLLTLFLSGLSLTAQDATKTPPGPPPTMIVVGSVDPMGTLTATQRVTRIVPVTVEKEVVQAGVAMKVTVTEYQKVEETVTTKVALKDYTIHDAKGEKVKPDAALKRLTSGSVILVSANGQKVDPAYLRIIKDDTLILVQNAAPPK
jgi:hypothetical protein